MASRPNLSFQYRPPQGPSLIGGGEMAPKLNEPSVINSGPEMNNMMPGIGAPSEPGQGFMGGGTNLGPGSSMPGIGAPPIGGGGMPIIGGPGVGFGGGHGPAPIAGGMPGGGGAPGMGGGMQGPGQVGGMPGIGAPGFQGPGMDGGGGGFGGGMPGIGGVVGSGMGGMPLVGGGMGPGFGAGLPGGPGMGGGMPGGGGPGLPGGGGGNMLGMPGGPGGQRPGQGGGMVGGSGPTTRALGEESGSQMGGGGFKGFPGFPGIGGGGRPGMGGGNTGPTTRAVGEESGGGMGGGQSPGMGGGTVSGGGGGGGMVSDSGPTTRALGEESGGQMGGGGFSGSTGLGGGNNQGIGGGNAGPTTRAVGEESGGQMGGVQQGGGFTGPGAMSGVGGPGASAPMVPSMSGGEGEANPAGGFQPSIGGIGPSPVGPPLGGTSFVKPNNWSDPAYSPPTTVPLSRRERTEQFANRIRDRWRRAGQEEMATRKPIYDASSPDGNSIGRRPSSDSNAFPLSDARKAALAQSDKASVDSELKRRQLDSARMGVTYNRNNDALNYLLDRARYGKRIPEYLNDLAQKSPNWDMERMKGTSPIHQVDSLLEQKKRSDVVRPSRNAVDNQPKIMASGGGGGGLPPMLLSPPSGGNATPSISPQRSGGRSYGSDIILPSGQQAAGANLGTGGYPRYSPPQATGSAGYGNDIIMPPTSPASGLIGNKSTSPSVPALLAGQPYGNDAITPAMQRGSSAPSMAVTSDGPATASPLGGPAQVPSQMGVPQSPPQLPVYSGNAGRESGIPLGSGQYDYSTMVGSLGQDAQRALDEYNAAVAQRDDLIRRLYEQRRKDTLGFQGNFGADVLGQFQNRADIANDIASRIGSSALQNTKDLFKQRRAGILSSAVNRGLGNTTILDSLLQGATREESKALNDVLDTIAQRRLGTFLGTSGDTLNAQMALGGQKTGLLAGLSKDFVDYLERINPVPPDLGMVADLARKAGLGGVGVPTKDVPFPKPQPYPFPVNNSYLIPMPMAQPQQQLPQPPPRSGQQATQTQSSGGDTMVYISPSMARFRGIDPNNPPPGVMVTPDGGPPKGSNSQRIKIGGGSSPQTQAPIPSYPLSPVYPGSPGNGQGAMNPEVGVPSQGGMVNIGGSPGYPASPGLPGQPGQGPSSGWPGVPYPWNPPKPTQGSPTSQGSPTGPQGVLPPEDQEEPSNEPPKQGWKQPHGPQVVSSEEAPPEEGMDLRDAAEDDEKSYEQKREEEQRSVYVPEDPNNWNEKKREQKKYLDSEINMWKQQQRTRSPKSLIDRRRIEADLERRATKKRRQLNQGFRQYQTRMAGLLRDYRRGRMSEQEYRSAAEQLYQQWKRYKDSIIPHY